MSDPNGVNDGVPEQDEAVVGNRWGWPGVRRLPPIYKQATWRNVTPVDDGFRELGVGFDLATGETIRMRLSVDHAKHLAGAISGYLVDHDVRIQSDKSPGMPSDSVSTPDE